MAGRDIHRLFSPFRPTVCPPKCLQQWLTSWHGFYIVRALIFLIHYLDDYLVFVPPGAPALGIRQKVESVLESVNAPIAHHKTEGPLPSLSFLGIQIDTTQFQLSLPHDKLSRLQSLLDSWKFRKSCTKQELESLAGHLSHAATVIRPGRIFLRSLFALMSRVSNPSHFVRLNLETRADLAWWQRLLHHWNGRSFFPLPTPSCQVYSDASGSFGCGAFLSNASLWFQLQWPDSWSASSIAAKELLPIIVASRLWGKRWSGNHVCFYCDNEAVVTVITKRRAKERLLSDLLRCLLFYAATFHFDFSATHISGASNTVADAISRNHLIIVSSLYPQASQVPVPAALTQFLWALPEWGSPSWMEQFNLSLNSDYL